MPAELLESSHRALMDNPDIISWEAQWANAVARWAIHRREWSAFVKDVYNLGHRTRIELDRIWANRSPL